MDLPRIQAHLQQALPSLAAIYVFGSQARGDARPGSDLDIAVLAAGRIDPLLLWSLAGELADIAGVPVDLVDLCGASTVFQYQIITTGQRIWAKGSAPGVYEAFILSEKVDLDERRAGLMRDISREGRIHAG